nr:uncharacterized protein LOC109161070 isoform X2 [Ipomoea trifida]
MASPSVNYIGNDTEIEVDSELLNSEEHSPPTEQVEPKPKRAKTTTSDVWKSFTKIGVVDASEKENVLRLHGDEHRKAALLARALVRTTVARYQINSHVDPRSLKFRKNIHGKPEVEWQHSDHWVPPLLHFNISHTTSLIACGVTVDSPEAYVKALGIGFSGAPFNTFTIRFKNSVGGSSHLSLNSDSKAYEIAVDYLDSRHISTSNWQFALIELDGSHYAAICTRKDSATDGKTSDSMKLTVWKTIPFLEDICVSGTDAVVEVNGMT